MYLMERSTKRKYKQILTNIVLTQMSTQAVFTVEINNYIAQCLLIQNILK